MSILSISEDLKNIGCKESLSSSSVLDLFDFDRIYTGLVCDSYSTVLGLFVCVILLYSNL